MNKKVEAARTKLAKTPHMIAINKPLPFAHSMIEEEFTAQGHRTLVRWNEQFYKWNGRTYRPVSNEDLDAVAYAFAAGRTMEDKEKINARAIHNVMHAARAITNVPSETEPPVLLNRVNGHNVLDPSSIVVCANGALDVKSHKLTPHHPRLFTFNATSVKYTPKARCPQWQKFLDQIMDAESQKLMQEFFGYCLTSDTHQEKGLFVRGPKRSGKGTMMRVLGWLIGEENVQSTTLADLAGSFGVEGAVGKTVMLLADTRSTRDSTRASEHLLRIIGRDLIEVSRKNKPPLSLRLPMRVMLMSNIIPAILDEGAALAEKFLAIDLTESFFGREDIHLGEKLHTELPGILNWAIVGLERLGKRERFVQPKAGVELLKAMVRKSTPLLAFIEDKLVKVPDGWVAKDALYTSYRAWCMNEHRDHTLTKERLFESLYSLGLRLKPYRPRVNGQRIHATQGLKFTEVEHRARGGQGAGQGGGGPIHGNI